MKELGGRRGTGVLVGLAMPLACGGTDVSGPHIMVIIWIRGEACNAENETVDL